jgi:cell division protein FtsA
LREDKLIFALDIGTRSVIGLVVQIEEDSKLKLAGVAMLEHGTRAMIDGQIDDIEQVSRCVARVKESLEKKLDIRLTTVAIAAAGRALRTQTVTMKRTLTPGEAITEEILRTMEMEAVAAAQKEVQDGNSERATFYCVGHSISKQLLDGYELVNVIGHRGEVYELTMIAAFLPRIVVESLYAAMDLCGLEVAAMTLEPIAAMNVVIPPDLRMLNLALVDIGAGTSDIAISRAGTVVAYDMATIAGDEITEALMKEYLLDFQSAESVKQKLCLGEGIPCVNILGIEQTLKPEEVMKKEVIIQAVGELVQTVADKIIEINGGSPTALFLVGGGSLYPNLQETFAQALSMEIPRVALGGEVHMKRVLTEAPESINSPAFITPLGIAWTALTAGGHNFGTVTVNGRKYRQYNFEGLRVLDLLVLSGHYKYEELVGYMGKPLRYYVDGQLQMFSGELAEEARIKINGEDGTLDSDVHVGDDVEFVPAINGRRARRTVGEAILVYDDYNVELDGVMFHAGTLVTRGGEFVSAEEEVQEGDALEIVQVLTLHDLIDQEELDQEADYYINGVPAEMDDRLQRGDVISSTPPGNAWQTKTINELTRISEESAQSLVSPLPWPPDTAVMSLGQPWTPAASSWQASPEEEPLELELNGVPLKLWPKDDGAPYLLFDLFNNVDASVLSRRDRVLKCLLNGTEASFTAELKNGDRVEIG